MVLRCMDRTIKKKEEKKINICFSAYLTNIFFQCYKQNPLGQNPSHRSGAWQGAPTLAPTSKTCKGQDMNFIIQYFFAGDRAYVQT